MFMQNSKGRKLENCLSLRARTLTGFWTPAARFCHLRCLSHSTESMFPPFIFNCLCSNYRFETSSRLEISSPDEKKLQFSHDSIFFSLRKCNQTSSGNLLVTWVNQPAHILLSPGMSLGRSIFGFKKWTYAKPTVYFYLHWQDLRLGNCVLFFTSNIDGIFDLEIENFFLL